MLKSRDARHEGSQWRRRVAARLSGSKAQTALLFAPRPKLDPSAFSSMQRSAHRSGRLLQQAPPLGRPPGSPEAAAVAGAARQ